MPRNGSGVYTLPPGINPVVTQTLITSNWANTTMSDLATAITQSLARDGQTVPTADLPMGGFHLTNLGDPVLRDQAATLGFVQDGKHIRLTGIAGVNQVQATLIGNTSALVVGQLLQFIPVANNTGAVTLDINGTGPKNVVTEVGSPLAAGNLVAGRPYILSYTGAEFAIVAGGGGSSIFAQSAMSGWDRPTQTGPYPVLTIVNPTTIGVPAGKGRIIKPSTRDLSGVTEVAWPAQNVVINAVATTWTTVLGVDANGQIVQFTGGLNSAWARENILLGTVAHINGQINDVITRPAIFGDMTYASYDLTVLFHNTLIAGGRVSPNAVNAFHVDITAGTLFSLGADSIDVNSPNILDFPSQFDIQFFPITGTSGVSAITQNVPVTSYDPGGAGVITPIPGGVATTSIHRMYFLAGEFLFQYGQATYPDLDTALSQIAVDSSANKPAAKLVNATLLGFLVIQKNCLDLKDTNTARFVSQGAFDFSIGSAGSISDAPINGLTYGRKDATWVEVVNSPKGPQATLRLIPYQTNTFLRFAHGLNDTPEGGANTGSDFEIRAFNDAGTLTGTAMHINRATRKVNFPVSIQLNGIDIANPSAGVFTGFLRSDGTFSNTLLNNLVLTAATTETRSIEVGQNRTGDGSSFIDLIGDATFTDFGLRIQRTAGANGGSAITHRGTGLFVISTTEAAGYSFRVSGSTRLAIDGTTGRVTFPVTGAVGGLGNGTAINGAVNTSRRFQIHTDGSVRWDFGGTGGAESGGNVGTDFIWNRFDDAGASLGAALTLARATGNASFAAAVSATGIITSSADVRANSNFASTNTSVVLATSAAGNIFLRPNGSGSAVGQTTIDSAGNVLSAGIITSAAAVRASQNFESTGINVVLANNGGAGTVFLRPNGSGSTVAETTLNPGGNFKITGGGSGAIIQDRTSTRDWQWYGSADVFRLHNGVGDIMTIDSSGALTSVNQTATSDETLKTQITPRVARRDLADLIDLYSYLWKSSGRPGLGQIAQKVREVAPEYVHEGTDGILSIDKASLAMECIIGLAARVRELEEKVNGASG